MIKLWSKQCLQIYSFWSSKQFWFCRDESMHEYARFPHKFLVLTARSNHCTKDLEGCFGSFRLNVISPNFFGWTPRLDAHSQTTSWWTEVTDVVANAAGIDAIVKRCDLIAAPLGDLTDEEFRKKLITEAFKLAGTGGPHQFEGLQDCKYSNMVSLLCFLYFLITNRRFSFFHDMTMPFLKVFGAW